MQVGPDVLERSKLRRQITRRRGRRRNKLAERRPSVAVLAGERPGVLSELMAVRHAERGEKRSQSRIRPAKLPKFAEPFGYPFQLHSPSASEATAEGR